PPARFSLASDHVQRIREPRYRHAGRAVYTLPFTQFDAFATGAAIPLFNLYKMRAAARWLLLSVAIAAVAGMAVLAIGHFWQGGASIWSLGFQMFMVRSYQYVWGYSLINIISALLIICALQRSPIVRPLDSGGLAHLGRISHGAYVYHLPLL